mmetsp:Transcript_122204/g.390892  ORF Transcript_122204/g.390892 Transcript_122204/m.390892 type:complete len:201 (+) Transcript_122204:314-916(+)
MSAWREVARCELRQSLRTRGLDEAPVRLLQDCAPVHKCDTQVALGLRRLLGPHAEGAHARLVERDDFGGPFRRDASLWSSGCARALRLLALDLVRRRRRPRSSGDNVGGGRCGEAPELAPHRKARRLPAVLRQDLRIRRQVWNQGLARLAWLAGVTEWRDPQWNMSSVPWEAEPHRVLRDQRESSHGRASCQRHGQVFER